ncbi:MAG: Na/Pi cotransporter family protein [Candidatus Marinimicrobia bacterium]|jgi:phosphate:Na+ symporter|nr:Na/Pi cotransporter family protein [Candidatus Neomarinimicrobiota bacterium]MBT3618734.1 Na/Pi cotransporter family protein [Candidatus Neomarinimicrobiota bacterium]MBT3828301.1 Na/Pi cotransporter family protein [Candidatus Neomarinimicrobiota bacterium]MBT3997238.1 Na/Pi cotransporter family protein [Candidatus Neomarinimicrobiota bacterium]MBT4280164.1 Na/Pi cotransporter family protein [Candidatus Neomarinimicrobiota bacterium]
MTRAQSSLLKIVALFGLLLLNPMFAGASGASDTISWAGLIMTLAGGLAFFLYGMEKMSEGMKKSAGDRMRNILSALTSNRFIAMFVGAFVTMVIQSSSATTVMLVSFVQAQLMTFVQSLGVILGADIGTTITAQLVAFKLTDYALLMIAVGFGMTMLSKKDSTKYIGEAILGFGILFFGMKLMSDAMKPLRTFQPFIDLLKGLENPVLGLLVGTLFTALVQSSSAFTGIVIVLAQQGLLSLEAGIPLVMGANIGTCITAGLASIGTSREAKRVAIAHVMFKVGGVLLFIFWIPTFADIIRSISPTSVGLDGMDKLASETPRQIANAHTIFNVSLALFFLPFTTMFANLIMKIYPEREQEKGIQPATWHLDDKAISTPAMAIDLARNEISRMSKIFGRMLEAIIEPFKSNELKQDEKYPQLSLVEGIEMREEKLDFLEEHIVLYLRKIGRQELSDHQIQEVYGMMSIVNDIESIGDIIEKNMIPLIAKKSALNTDFSEEGKEELDIFHTKICKQVSRLKDAFSELDPELAKRIMAKEEKYTDLETEYRTRHLERLHEEREESIETHEIHMELMDLLKQINVYTGDIAKTIHSIGETSPE